MIYKYGITQRGTYHTENDIVCQDAHFIKVIGDHYAIAAIADGLGSELYSDIASKLAVEHSVSFCEDRINTDCTEDDILAIIKESFSFSLSAIYKYADDNNNERNQFDTTLALAVFFNGTLYYGNSGDSGIIALLQDGSYVQVTKQQRDEYGYVFPLCFGEDYWVFGKIKDVSSVLLATDGMLELFFPYLLKNEPTQIYVALAHFLMSEEKLHFTIDGEDTVQKKVENFVTSISAQQVSDDKTIVVLLDSDKPYQRQPEDYYATPDWKALKERFDEEYRRAAYPQLYQSDKLEHDKCAVNSQTVEENCSQSASGEATNSLNSKEPEV